MLLFGRPATLRQMAFHPALQLLAVIMTGMAIRRYFQHVPDDDRGYLLLVGSLGALYSVRWIVITIRFLLRLKRRLFA